MAVTTTKTNKPLNPRGNDQSPKGYNRAALYSGKALDFDGVNDQITTGQDLGNLQTLSVAMHCRIDNFTDGSGRSPISQWHGSDGWMIYKSGGGSELIFYRNANFFAWSDSAKYSDQWIHLVYVIEQGVGAYVYANGQLVASDTTFKSNLDYTNNPTLKIGAFGNTSGGFLNGAINGVKIFNTALTAAQVSDLYNNPEKIVPTGVADSALKLWLPMMEGAGTTAYDGSGNGNHGTISGATWTHGIGAPVSQTAVIDWNKGTNKLQYHSWGSGYTANNSSISTSTASSPDGVETAFIFDDGTLNTYHRAYKLTSCAAGEVTASTFVKKKDVDYINIVLGVDGGSSKDFALVNLVNGTIITTSGSPTATSIQSVGDGWYYVSVQETHAGGNAIIYIYGQDPTNGSSIDDSYTGANNQTYIWGASVKEGAINNVFVPTYGTIQSSDVLLPAGLTTGRDITGVNLFENVRKQGALNLDGNSWAEMHDNASLDFGTGDFTLEAWAKVKFVSQGSSVNTILALGGPGSNSNSAAIFVTSSNAPSFYYSGNGSTAGSKTEGDWVHIVGVYDETNATIYINATQEDQDARTAVNITNALVKHIGRDSTTFRYYNDQIAQPRIYNRALTAEEVERNYNAGKNIYK